MPSPAATSRHPKKALASDLRSDEVRAWSRLEGWLEWRSHFEDILRAADPRPFELFSGTCSLLWGAWLLMQPEALITVTAFKYLNFLPAPAWSGLFLSLGTWRMFALGKNGRRMRQAACMGACIAWLFIGALVLQGNHASPNGGIYVLLSLSNFWVWFRLRGVLHG